MTVDGRYDFFGGNAMPMNMFEQTFTIPGTLAANHTFSFKMPTGATLVHVSACNSSANAGTLDIGSSSDDDAYLDGKTFGVSGTPTEAAARSAFVGSEYPHFADGDVIAVTVTDHGSHMANVCVVLTFEAG